MGSLEERGAGSIPATQTRICAICLKLKQIDSFEEVKNQKGFKARRNQCSECRKQYYKDHYKNNEQRRKRIRDIGKKKCNDNVRKYVEFLLEHPCIDCGEKNIILLELDHLNNKSASVSSMVYRHRPWEIIKEEINKCVVRCVRCHRLKTAKEQKWYKLVLLEQLGR